MEPENNPSQLLCTLVRSVLRVPEEIEERPAQMENKERLAQGDGQESLGTKDGRDHEGIKDPLDPRVVKVHSDREEWLGKMEREETKAHRVPEVFPASEGSKANPVPSVLRAEVEVKVRRALSELWVPPEQMVQVAPLAPPAK